MKNTLKRLLYSILFVALFASCISKEEVNYLQDIKSSYIFKPHEEYKLTTGDIINCWISTGDQEFLASFNTVLSNSRNGQQTYTIYKDSSIIIPFFGTVKIAGLTLQQAEKKIQSFMQESIVDAQAQIELGNKFFYIYANDNRGVYMVYKENLTIYQALAISGQTTGQMDLSKVQIVRKGKDGEDIVKIFDLRTTDVIQSEYYYVEPNDVIYFSTSKKAFFNISSIGGFFQTIVGPLNFFINVLVAYKVF